MDEDRFRLRGTGIEHVDVWLRYKGGQDGAVVACGRVLDPGAFGKSINQAGGIEGGGEIRKGDDEDLHSQRASIDKLPWSILEHNHLQPDLLIPGLPPAIPPLQHLSRLR